MQVGIVLLFGLVLGSPTALGQPYPDRPIRAEAVEDVDLKLSQ